MEAADDPRPGSELQGLRLAIFSAQGLDEAGHFGLAQFFDANLLTTPIGQAHICDFVIILGGHGLLRWGGFHNPLKTELVNLWLVIIHGLAKSHHNCNGGEGHPRQFHHLVNWSAVVFLGTETTIRQGLETLIFKPATISTKCPLGQSQQVDCVILPCFHLL